jgi:hypothetical protein
MINLDGARPKASIAWLGAPEPGTRLAALIAQAGYRVHSSPSVGRIDVAVADLRSKTDATATDVIAAARRLAPAAGVLILAPDGCSADARAQLRRQGDVCFVRGDPTLVVGAVRERLRLGALADETGERIKSLIADRRTVSFGALSHEAARLSVLIAGRPSPLTLNACNAVRDAASQTTCVFSAGQVMRALDHGMFDGAIFLPSDENDLLLALARALRRHREHRRLPVILASPDETLLARCAARDGFDAILAEHIEDDLCERLQTTARRAHMANAMRKFLRSPDGGSGAGARFFAQHAIRQFRRADQSESPLSLVGLSMTPKQADRTLALGAALADAQKIIVRIVRAEDLVARLTQTTLVLMTRGAGAADAARIAERIEGVLAGTLMRSALDIARIDAAAVERAPGDGVETTVAALIRKLNEAAGDARAVR